MVCRPAIGYYDSPNPRSNFPSAPFVFRNPSRPTTRLP
jgi:hypothetical protein